MIRWNWEKSRFSFWSRTEEKTGFCWTKDWVMTSSPTISTRLSNLRVSTFTVISVNWLAAFFWSRSASTTSEGLALFSRIRISPSLQIGFLLLF